MKKAICSIFGMAVALLMTGCSDFLDSKNLSSPENADDYFAKHPDQIRPVAYSALRDIATQIDLLDQAGDLYINPRAADDGVFSMFTVVPDNGTVAGFYHNIYKAINKANCMIHYAGENKELEAEGRFLRVFCYYYLTQQFGPVPYVDYYIQTAERDFPRTPLNELYEILLQDCDDIYNNSPLDPQNHEGGASKQAVAAIAAKIALAAAWDLDTELVDAVGGKYSVKDAKYFRLAAQWAEKAIMNIPLTMSFQEKWAWNNEGNAEEIFSAQWERDGFPGNLTTGGNNMMYQYTGYYGNPINSGLKGTGSGGTNMPSAKAATLFEPGDTRFEGTFMTTMYNAPLVDKKAVWEEGYMAWYNKTPEEQAKLPIALKFYSPSTTVAEAEADIRQMVADGRAKRFAVNTYGVNEPFAAIITGTEVTKWEFNTAGTMPSRKKVEFTSFIREAANNGTCVTKYDDPESSAVTSGQCFRDIPFLHVSEMYLTAAEAYLLAGDEPKSLQYINAVRKRAGAKELNSYAEYEAPYTTNINFQFVPLDLLLDERARECYAERTRFYDLRRTKQLVRYNLEFSRFIKNVSQMSNAEGQIKWYRPIPQAEIDSNTGISREDQNPGY